MSVAIQNALAAIDASVTPRADDSQLLIAAKCRGLLHGYDARWHGAGYVPTGVEEFVQADLYNPETNRKSRTFRLAGKLDIKAKHLGRTAIIDHKTTSLDITNPDAPYWRQLIIEGQVSHYLLLEWLNGRKVDEAVWDVTRKPSIRPKKLSKAERASAVAERKYFGRKLSIDTLTAMQVDETETLEMYEARLANDCTHERPDWYFQRRSVPRLDGELLEYAAEIWEHAQEILHANNNQRYARNSGACLLYGSPCKFLGICSGHDDVDSDKWQRKSQVHNELPIVEGDGRDLLTNSRIRCFQTCRRKHQYEYGLGIERQDEEEKESLFFGSLYHLGLNSWWSTFLEGTNNDDASDCSPDNEFGERASDQTAAAF